MNRYTQPPYLQNTYQELSEDDSDDKIRRFVDRTFWEFYDCWREYVSDFEDDLFFY